ncbi:WD40/YVTN/BNR-like repeat-containing protein [Bifidobacterium cuniculi]|uniref:WD40/YVTN/BNR-like repeat-containing protein n=1 Tax=Bifidobacterium cuniculi TaxID=1688 RepID=UPI000A5F3BF2|nr:oxidoreductase [Bifidobacterium cuniculi]
MVACLLSGVGARLVTWWHDYKVPSMAGQVVARVSEDSLASDDVAQWYGRWMGKLREIGVAPQYQLSSVQVRDVRRLADVGDDSRHVYVQLDATVHARFPWWERITELHGCQVYDTGSGIDESCVFKLEPQEGGYRIVRVMEPIAYQRAADPEQFEKSEPDPTAPVLDGENGYRITSETLEVTYDGGTTWRKVPDGVTRIVGDVNANTELWLDPASYVITPDFTAFVGYDDAGHQVQLVYSWDAGSTWLTSTLGKGMRAASYVSVAGDRIGVAYGYDAALGSVGYAMVASSLADLRADGAALAWQDVPMYMQYPSNLTMMGWTDDATVFVGQAGSLHVSSDGGATWRKAVLPKEPGLADRLGFDPFDVPVRVWVQDGTTYLAIGQGDDADYAPDGTIVEALFSYDAASDAFAFVREQAAPVAVSAG